jgi:hypothetical protein
VIEYRYKNTKGVQMKVEMTYPDFGPEKVTSPEFRARMEARHHLEEAARALRKTAVEHRETKIVAYMVIHFLAWLETELLAAGFSGFAIVGVFSILSRALNKYINDPDKKWDLPKMEGEK